MTSSLYYVYNNTLPITHCLLDFHNECNEETVERVYRSNGKINIFFASSVLRIDYERISNKNMMALVILALVILDLVILALDLRYPQQLIFARID